MSNNRLVPSMINRFRRTGAVIGPESTISPLAQRGAFYASEWFVDPQNGSDAADGRDPTTPRATLAALIGNGSSSLAKSGDTIYVVGNITEEVTGWNLLEDISIIGVSNRPRHADHARDIATYTTYPGVSGASWRQASSHTAEAPLLKIRGQGWHIENILFVPPSDAAAVYLDTNALSNVSEYSAGHARFINCRFDAGQSGIEDSGGAGFVEVSNCQFRGSTNGIKTLNTAVAIPLCWIVRDNIFMDNTNHIVCSASRWVVKGNVSGKFTTLGFSLAAVSSQGEYNSVHANYLSGDYDAGYLGGSNDDWAGNYSMDVTSAEVGAEGLTILAPVA